MTSWLYIIRKGETRLYRIGTCVDPVDTLVTRWQGGSVHRLAIVEAWVFDREIAGLLLRTIRASIKKDKAVGVVAVLDRGWYDRSEEQIDQIVQAVDRHHARADVAKLLRMASQGMPGHKELAAFIEATGRFIESWRRPETMRLLIRSAQALARVKDKAPKLEPKKVAPKVRPDPDGFAAFMAVYQKDTTWKESLGFWNTMSDENRTEARADAPAYVASTPDKSKRLDPIRYLNRQRYRDTYRVPAPEPVTAKSIFVGETAAREVAARLGLSFPEAFWSAGADSSGRTIHHIKAEEL